MFTLALYAVAALTQGQDAEVLVFDLERAR